MEVQKLSGKYMVRQLRKNDINEIYELCIGNFLYYEYCPPLVSKESIREDMATLPPGKELSDKYYLGFYSRGKLVAVLDLIVGYPQEDTIFIGFFMTDVSCQKRGIGSEIISELCDELKENHFRSVRLAWVKGNPQAEHFWLKNQFIKIKETTSTAAEKVILAERLL